jgi:hypothetical protein
MYLNPRMEIPLLPKYIFFFDTVKILAYVLAF